MMKKGRYLPWMVPALVVFVAVCFVQGSPALADETPGLRVATFDIDVTPPMGTHLAYDRMVAEWDLGLRARGIVLLGAGDPIVLCSFDWIGIANGSNDAFRGALADAAGTTPARVTVHTVHQHDAPACDFSAEEILKARGIQPQSLDGTFAREVLPRLARAVRDSLEKAQPVTHLGLGAAPVSKVASNRRILGPDGKVRATRYTTCANPALRAEPEGTIDPMVSVVSLWNGEQPVAVLSYYACHPQSYYRTGIPNPDFPGIARFLRQLAVPAALHIHFNGAGGNIGAGKYNDGSHENRLILAERLADGMRRAWENAERAPLTPEMVNWRVVPVALPPARHLNTEALEAMLEDNGKAPDAEQVARDLAWLQRCQSGHEIDVTCLELGRARLLHLPGELLVEYQLGAKATRPDLFVALAAYGDYGPGYICPAVAYEQGGYEASERASGVAPEVEAVLTSAIRELLAAQP